MHQSKIPGLDGLRAVAALMVFGAHSDIPYLYGGGIGVDIFFVLSGFVITRSLINEIYATGKIAIGSFYVRRALRLWPVLISVCLAFWLLHGDRIHVGRELLPSLFYYSNWTRAWAWYPVTFGHTWSLSIEEQFYLLWPLLLLLALRDRRPALAVLGLAIFAGLWRFWLYEHGTLFSRLFNGLDTRGEALMIGAALALAKPEIRKRLAHLWPIAIVVFCWAVVYERWNSPWLYSGGLTGLAVMAAALIAKISTDPDSVLTRMLEWRPIAGLGVISYAFYVWHFPVLHFYLETLGAPLCLLIVLACAIASWVLMERPLQGLRKRLAGIRAQPSTTASSWAS